MNYEFSALEHAYLYEATKIPGAGNIGDTYVNPLLIPCGFNIDPDGIRFDYYNQEPVTLFPNVVIGRDTRKLVAIQGLPTTWISQAERSPAALASIQILKLILEMVGCNVA